MAGQERDIAGYAGARLIGRGGFGAVYRATDATHGREVAIKVLPGTLGEAERRRFDRERQTMGRLGAHPHIIPVYESGYTADGEGYIVMELATGGSLRDRLQSSGPLPWNEAARIMASIADATQAAHDNGVLHRDIKPDNILIDQFANPKLSDFGIAAVASNVTTTTSTTATIAHAAPEVLQGRPSTNAVDIYAIGSTLHALITGLPPFVRAEDDGVTPMITRALTEPPPDLRPFGVPDTVAQVVERALAKDPSRRQASAAQLSRELTAAATGAVPTASEPLVPGAVHAPTIVHFPPPGRPDQLAAPAPGSPIGSPARATTPIAPQPLGATASSWTTAGQPHAAPVRGGAGGGGSRAGWWGLIVVAVVTALAGLGVILVLVARSDDSTATGTGESGETTAGTDTTLPVTEQPTSAPTTPAAVGEPTVEVDCPSEIPLGSTLICSILTTNAVSGEWNLPAFLPAPEAIEVPGEYEIFIEPTNPTAVGETFTITATAEGRTGTVAEAALSFVVVDPVIEIDCPGEIPLNRSIDCDIITYDVVEGEWDIPAFGGAALEVVPGTNPIFIEPGDPAAVGRRFTIDVTVRDASGFSYTATSEFVVTPAGG